MEKHEFYSFYVNLPLEKRGEFLGYEYRILGGQYLTPKMIYKEISEIDEKIGKDESRRDRLLMIAEQYKNDFLK